MFGALLGIIEHLLFEFAVPLMGFSSFSGSGDRAKEDFIIRESHHHFRRRAANREFLIIKQKEIRGGVFWAKNTIETERIDLSFLGVTVWEQYLKNITASDVLLGFIDHLLKSFFFDRKTSFSIEFDGFDRHWVARLVQHPFDLIEYALGTLIIEDHRQFGTFMRVSKDDFGPDQIEIRSIERVQ